MRVLLVGAIVVFFLLGGCQNTPRPSSNYMVLDEIVYIDHFPQVYSLSNGTVVDLGIIGTLSMSVRDSLLIVTTQEKQGMWSFFSLPDYYNMGKYFTQGRGPNEFISTPWVEQQFFFKEQSRLFSIIYDFTSGKSYRMNVSKTLQDNKLSMSETGLSLPRTLFGRTFMDTTRVLCREVNIGNTQMTRYVLNGGRKETSANLEKISLASIRPGEDINILSVHAMCRPNGDRIVEAAIGLNQINLYSLDNSFGKTICVGKRIDNISRVQDIERSDRMYTYMSTNVFPDFFGALYLNDTEMNYQSGKAGNPVIQFFNWDGDPLAEVKMDRMITSFTIDFTNGNLYTLNLNTEEIYKYDINHILAKLL